MTNEEGFHGEMCRLVEKDSNKNVLLLEPRGSLKSSCVTIGLPIREIIKDPDIRILICSEEFMTAQKFLAEITGHIENNTLLRSLYGDLKGDSTKWNEKEIIVGTRKTWRKEPTITCAGIDVTKVGLHYDLVIIDDPHSYKNSQNREQIDKVISWYKLVLSLLDPGKKLIIIGTRWAYDDLAGWIIAKEHERRAVGLKKRFRIIQKDAILTPQLDENTTDDELLWPERLSKEFLLDTRLDQGPYIFGCQYRNRPVDDDSAMFKRSWVKFYDPKLLPPIGMLNTYATLDPIRDDESDDFAAIAVVSFDANWVGYIREIRRGKWDEYETLEQLIRVNRIWKPKKIGVEVVAWQKLYYKFLKAELIRRNLKIPITTLKTDTRVSKKLRVRSMTPYWKTGLYRIPGVEIATLEGNMAIFMDELLRYPRTKNDDCVDALAYIDQLSHRPKPSEIVRMVPVGSFMHARQQMKRYQKSDNPFRMGAGR